ncbi:hypothetical protein ACQ4PT_002537 [Festuca glaucescens]
MSAWRSLFNRHQPLLSCLRPVGPHVTHRTAVLGSHSSLISSRGYDSNNSNGDSKAEVNRQLPAAKRHLYVVLDDSKDGFGIHKLDVDDDNLGGGTQHLPEPPLLRVAFPTVDHRAQFAVVGSSIVAVGSCDNMHISEKDDPAGGVLIYDTKTVAQVFSPQLPKGFLRDWCVYQAAIAVGNRLYMFESIGSEYHKHIDDDWWDSGLHCLTADRGGEDDEFWCWQPLCPLPMHEEEQLSPSCSWWWSDNDCLLELPFRADRITAYGVYTAPGAAPHEHEIFVSVSSPPRNQRSATFSFRPPMHPATWIRHGDWYMPIIGHAHYDGKLDKWLGLHLAYGYKYNRWPDGYLCAGKVTSDPSEWKVGKQKLCCLDEDTAAGWIHVDAKLVPMATADQAGTEYCLMERLKPEGGDCLGDGDKCLMRLTTFRVKSGENGEPVAMASRPGRSYKVSRYSRFFEARVFWM